MSSVQKRIVTEDESGMRLDRWFRTHFPELRHGALEKCLRTGQIRIDGARAKANRRVEAGEEIRIPPLDEARPAPVKEKAPNAKAEAQLRRMILFEDDAVIAINKPFGLAVQGGAKTSRHIDGMLAGMEKNGERPRLVHRLDKDTGGLLLIGKTRKATQSLADAFKHKRVEKTYWALTAGVPRPRQGTIDAPVGKQETGDAGERVTVGEGGKRAVSHYQVIDEAGPIAFVAMRPVTGRTHQLRVHAAAIETPIVGDGKYGGAAARIEGISPKLHLFCRSMTFPHPKTGKLVTLTAPVTEHMRESLRFFSFDDNAVVEWPETLK